MKKFLICLFSALVAIGAVNAKKMSDLKIYINPGHGGYTSNDRPITLEFFASGDTAGYWESKSNLYKGLHMYHILDSLGAKVYLSRIKNTEADDRDLYNISSEANRLGVDLFFSIHSNAGESTNFPLMLYREQTRGVPRYPENVTLSNIHWDNLYSSKLAIWTRHSRYVEGDINFYWNSWKTGLGVLRQLYVIGLLSEGSNHEHRPEAFRLMNDDYLWLEAWHFVRSIMEYYNTEDRFVTGNVAGIVYDNNNIREKDLKIKFTAHDRDKYAVVNGAFVELLDANGNVVQKRTTDNFHNGVFVFRNVKPGQYKVRTSHENYYTEEVPVTVEADKVTYNDMPMVMKRPGNLQVTSFSPENNATEVSCSSKLSMTFNYDIDVESFEKGFNITPEIDGGYYFKYSDSYKKVEVIPNISLVKQTEYVVTLAKDIKSADTYNSDPTLGADNVFKFNTADYDVYEMIASYPTDGGTVDYRKPVLEFRFDSRINQTGYAEKFVVKDEAGKVVPFNTRSCKFNQLSNGYGNAVLALNTNLVPGAKYTVTVDEMLRNTENLPLGVTYVFNFTAVDNGLDKDGELMDDFERTTVMFTGDEENSKGLKAKPTCSRSTADKLFDKSSAKLGYSFANFREGEAYWTYNEPNETPVQVANGDVIGLHVNGDLNNHELYIGLSGGSDTKYFKICNTDFKGWKYFTVPVEGLLDDLTYHFIGFKLVQTESPAAQIGNFCVDNMMIVKNSNSIDGITADNSGISIEAAGGKIVITTDAPSVNTLYDMLGRIIIRTTNSEIEAPAGVYVVKVATSDNTVAKRVVLQ